MFVRCISIIVKRRKIEIQVFSSTARPSLRNIFFIHRKYNIIISRFKSFFFFARFVFVMNNNNILRYNIMVIEFSWSLLENNLVSLIVITYSRMIKMSCCKNNVIFIINVTWNSLISPCTFVFNIGHNFDEKKIIILIKTYLFFIVFVISNTGRTCITIYNIIIS